MSGRSAYVRKKNNELMKKPAPPRRPTTQQQAYAGYGQPLAGDGSLQSSSFSRQRSGTSISSGSEVDQYGRRPTLPTLETGIEKSALRSFMDSKSDKVRNKLASTITGSAPRTDDPSPVRPGSSASPERSYEPSQATSPIPVPIPHRPRARGHHQEESFDMGHRSGRSGDMGPLVKRWTGNGRLPAPWHKLKKDPELWDPLGDTLVFFGHDLHGASPSPSFRIASSVLEETESAFLITILREGYTYNNDFDFPPSPNSPPDNAHHANGSPIGRSHSIGSGSDNTLPIRSPKALQSMHHYMQKGQPTPPSSSEPRNVKGAAPVLHEIYFPAPLNQSKTDTVRHHLTTRNVFALLMDKSLVGLNLFQALADLHERLEMYMPPESDNTSMIIDYIVSKGLDDVRNDPASAAGLLAWSEMSNVRWREGWREAFVHCAGMYSRLINVPEVRDISAITRALLERAHLDLQVRVSGAEEKLAAFDLNEMWPPMNSSLATPPARASFERFRKFLIKFYEHVYWAWPPQQSEDREGWLTRDLVQRLQRDFGALYDYLVDRDVEWDESEFRSGRKWDIVSKSAKADFHADTEDLPITEILISFDNKYRFQHVPHPFPIVPESIPPAHHATKQGGLFSGKKPKPSDDRSTEKRAALAYSEATNIYHLGSEFVSNELVEAFSRFEKTDRPGEIDPYVARKGRWVLLYGILQILSTLSVDTPGLRFVDDVQYFLSPKLRGTPPWRTQAEPSIEEANPLRSHCWIVPRTWTNAGDEGDDTTHEAARHRRQQQRWRDQAQVLPGVTASGRERSSSGETETRTIDETRRRAKQWVNNGGAYANDGTTESAPRWQKEKVRGDWPIGGVGVSGLASSISAGGTSTISAGTNAQREGVPLLGGPMPTGPASRRYRGDVGVSDYEPPPEWNVVRSPERRPGTALAER